MNEEIPKLILSDLEILLNFKFIMNYLYNLKIM